MRCLHRPRSFLHRRNFFFFTGIHLLLISHSKQWQLDRHSSLKANPDAEDKPPEYDRQEHRKLTKLKRTACRPSITIAEIKRHIRWNWSATKSSSKGRSQKQDEGKGVRGWGTGSIWFACLTSLLSLQVCLFSAWGWSVQSRVSSLTGLVHLQRLQRIC